MEKRKKAISKDVSIISDDKIDVSKLNGGDFNFVVRSDDMVNNLKKDIDEKLIKDQEIKNKQYKLKNNLADIEKDI